MRNLFRDASFAFRMLLARPAFALVAVLTLGLGIACTGTVFSWIDSLLLHPYAGASRSGELAVLEMVTPSAPNGGTRISWPDYRDYRDHMKSLSGLAVHRQSAFAFGDAEPAALTWGELVSGNFFEVMGVHPLAGRLFTQAADGGDEPGAHPVTVISARLWRSQFRADPSIAGKTVRVNRHTLTIVGVAPAKFRGSSPIMQYDLWVPVTMGPALGLLPEAALVNRESRGMLDTICRRRPGVSIEQARGEAVAIAASLAASFSNTNRGIGATILPTWEEHNGVNEYLRAPLAILLAVSFLVLLIVCANVANLLLARSIGRQREFGIRCALGAGRSRVACQVLTETLMLCVAGAGVGLVILLWLQGSLTALVPSIGFPIQIGFELNGRILAFTALACVAAALLAGASPALFVFHTNLNEVLKAGGRSGTGGSTASSRMRNALVISEVALAMVALAGAGVFVKSFLELRAIRPGFEPGQVLLARFFIETAGYSGPQIQQFALRLEERLRSDAGIEAVSYSDFVPLSGSVGPYNNVQPEGYVPAVGESNAVNRAIVSPGYFATLQIPLVDGREFSERDEEQSEPVIIVNQTFAARYFAGRNPLGRKVRAAGKVCTVVGVARDSKYFSPADRPGPHFYLPFAQFYRASPELYFLVRTSGRPADAIPSFRRAVTETGPNASAVHAVPFAEYTEVVTFGQKVAATLIGGLALLCLLLAGSGLYSVMSYMVSQRTSEIGIRMAMGATPGDVVGMIVKQGLWIALAGIALGTAAALASLRLVASYLFGVSRADPASFAAAGFFLLTVTLLATGLPALRAIRTDPTLALRC